MTDLSKRLTRAVEFLWAEPTEEGRWAYWDYGTSRYWVVDTDDLEQLTDYLDDPNEYEPYQAWCDATWADEMPEGWEPPAQEGLQC